MQAEEYGHRILLILSARFRGPSSYSVSRRWCRDDPSICKGGNDVTGSFRQGMNLIVGQSPSLELCAHIESDLSGRDGVLAFPIDLMDSVDCQGHDRNICIACHEEHATPERADLRVASTTTFGNARIDKPRLIRSLAAAVSSAVRPA